MEEPSLRQLFRRMARPLSYASGLVFGSLALGMAGYHWLVKLPWVDAFENTAMLLGGMGPVAEIGTSGGKIFAGVFALYAGLVFLVVTALVLSPVFHHVLHRFHWEAKKQS